jgi:PleD family two-component response regulator
VKDAEGRVAHMVDTNRSASTPVHTVVLVNGNTEALRMLEAMLDAVRYDIVFVEPNDRVYSRIKSVVPSLVILCRRLEEPEQCQLLTMLKLDPETKDIPILDYATEDEGQDSDAAVSQLADEAEDLLRPRRPALWMN